MKKILSCFILFSTLIIANFAAASDCTISGNEMVCSYTFSASLFSNTGGSSGAGPGPMEDPKVVASRVAAIKEGLKAECKKAAEKKQRECADQERDDFAWNVNVCNGLLGLPGAMLTGSVIMDVLKKTGKVGKVAAVLGSGLVYGAIACKDWAAANRDADIAQCTTDLANEMSNHCDKI